MRVTGWTRYSWVGGPLRRKVLMIELNHFSKHFLSGGRANQKSLTPVIHFPSESLYYFFF